MNHRQIARTDSEAYSQSNGSFQRNGLARQPGACFAFVLLLFALPAFSQWAHASDVTLVWNANSEPELAGYKLYYGIASRQYDKSIDVGNVVTYKVAGLSGGTYYFALTAYSSTEETDYSNEISVVIPSADTNPPSILGVAATAITSSTAAISWTTDEPADTQVEYGLSTGYGSMTATDPVLRTAHTVALGSLAAGTTYHYRVKSRDAAGNLAVSGDLTFATGAPPDTKAPVLSSIRAVSVSNNSVTITWISDEPADSQVEYGASTSYGSLTALNPALLTSHSQILSGLSSGTCYHFRVKSRDAAGNQAVSGDATFTTASLPDIDSGLVAAYAFDEGAGAVAVDSSGSSNAATLNNASWTTKAKFGRALSFNGKNSYVTAGVTGLPAVAAPKTISCWLNVSAGAGDTQSVIALANEAQQASVRQAFKSSQVGMLQYAGAWLVAGNSPSSKAWHHFAYTFDGSQNRLYVDGVQVSSSTIQPQVAPVASFQIGRWITGADYFKGSIDEVRIYNRALSQEEIAAVMNTPIGGSQTAGFHPAAKLEVVGDDIESEGDPATEIQREEEPDAWPAVTHDSRVAIDIRMTRGTYHTGETVSTSSSWLSNPSQRSREIELKAWLAAPGFDPISAGALTSDGVQELPAAFDEDLGPLSLFDVSGDLPAGTYQLNARILDPVTGDTLDEDINPFSVTADMETPRRSRQYARPADAKAQLAIGSHSAALESSGISNRRELVFANRGDAPADVELKVWVEGPEKGPVSVFTLGGNGSLLLPASSALNLDPLALLQHSRKLPAGSYQLRSRILDSVTGHVLSENIDDLVIR